MRARRSNIDDESAGSTLSTQYALWLWVALGLFCLRVVAQLLVATLPVSFLPQMEEWFSGLVPYPSLLVFQFLIVGLCGAWGHAIGGAVCEGPS